MFWLLPQAERRFFLFPVFVLLGGSMGSAFASVADGATAAAYAWVLFFLLRFAPLTRGHAAAILVLSLGALRLHEAMAYLGPILAATCLRRRSLAMGTQYERGLLVVAGLLALSSAVGLGYILLPHTPGNRASFVSDMLSLRWFFATEQGLNVPALLGLLGLAAVALASLAAVAVVCRAGFCRCGDGCVGGRCCGRVAGSPRRRLCRPQQWRLAQPAGDGALPVIGASPRAMAGEPRLPAPSGAMLALALAVIDFRATRDWRGYIGAFETALRTERGVVPLGSGDEPASARAGRGHRPLLLALDQRADEPGAGAAAQDSHDHREPLYRRLGADGSISSGHLAITLPVARGGGWVCQLGSGLITKS